MRIKLLMAVVFTFLLGSAAALAATPPSAQDRANAATICAGLRTAIGATTFKQTYGTNANRSDAYGKCVSRWAQTEQLDRDNAAKACTAEQNDPNFAANHGGKTFAQFYGTGKTHRNAFGDCVSGKVKAATTQQAQATVTAAATCKKQRANDPAGFKAKYGSKRNAFGKCVASVSKV
jgi:hypothetical protein